MFRNLGYGILGRPNGYSLRAVGRQQSCGVNHTPPPQKKNTTCSWHGDGLLVGGVAY